MRHPTSPQYQRYEWEWTRLFNRLPRWQRQNILTAPIGHTAAELAGETFRNVERQTRLDRRAA
jgi:hypothetical protein